MAAGKSSKELQAEQLEALRKVARETSARTTDADTARAMADAAARVKAEAPPPGSPIGAKMPLAAKYANGTVSRWRAANSKIWEVDHRKSFIGRKIDPGAWQADGRRAIRETRVKGNPKPPLLAAVMQRLAHYTRVGKGCALVTHATLASEVQTTCESIRQTIRWMESRALVVTQNTMQTIGNLMMRGPNRYYIRERVQPPAQPQPQPSTAPAADAPAAELAPLQRMQADLSWLAQFFKGLVVRTAGLNTTGLRLGRPEPA